MNTINYSPNSNISFGTLVPTKSLLMCGIGKGRYQESKELCLAIEEKFPGYKGFYKKAQKLIITIKRKNPEIRQIMYDISKIENPAIQKQEINKVINNFGSSIDVNI